MAMLKSPKSVASARNVGSVFFPQRDVLSIGAETFSPGVKTKAVIVATETKSYKRAEIVLDKVGEIKMSSRHIGRMAMDVGQQLLDRQRGRAELLACKKLPVEVENVPSLAVVSMDGGRIRTRQQECGSGTHEPRWRESKNALFLRMHSDIHENDPCPELPAFLQNRRYVRKLVLEMSGSTDGVEEPPDEEIQEENNSKYDPPERLMRTCLSSLDCSKTFGPLMAAEAHRKGFFQASRQAFIGDGMKCNWTIQKKHFPTFTPIVDLMHAVSYLYHAAVAIGETEDFGWGLCLEWTRACWQGRVGDVIAEMSDWLSQQSKVTAAILDDDPRRIVQRALTYLTNNRSRMNYPAYRKQGLPLTSALMESLIKEINWRVKGTEKFWNDPGGANPILALKAASLCDDDRIDKFLSDQ